MTWYWGLTRIRHAARFNVDVHVTCELSNRTYEECPSEQQLGGISRLLGGIGSRASNVGNVLDNSYIDSGNKVATVEGLSILECPVPVSVASLDSTQILSEYITGLYEESTSCGGLDPPENDEDNSEDAEDTLDEDG